MLHEAIQYVDIVDDQGKEVKSWLAKQILRDAKAIFGNDNFSSYIYFSILYEVCCWMKILAPIKVSDKGYAERLELLDPRRISPVWKGWRRSSVSQLTKTRKLCQDAL